jgi:hypothetical protein
MNPEAKEVGTNEQSDVFLLGRQKLLLGSMKSQRLIEITLPNPKINKITQTIINNIKSKM